MLQNIRPESTKWCQLSPIHFANLLSISLLRSQAQLCRRPPFTPKTSKTLTIHSVVEFSRDWCDDMTNSNDFSRKFNIWLLFSTFVWVSVEITNIISVICQQAPEYHVSKITERLWDLWAEKQTGNKQPLENQQKRVISRTYYGWCVFQLYLYDLLIFT